ncbi:MAG TPA: 30S ribosomal protein S20 [Firmicutes bacterium]|nr:30S ribosomal protein S20 [Caldisericia bacterium]HDH63055.1 30S ribosomal protein S20 [Bacillota bacterium]
MAKRTKSALKNARKNLKRRMRNKYYKTRTKNLIKSVFLSENREEAEKRLKEAISFIDHATSKGVFHKNTAARKKSRLMKRFSEFIIKLEEEKLTSLEK